MDGPPQSHRADGASNAAARETMAEAGMLGFIQINSISAARARSFDERLQPARNDGESFRDKVVKQGGCHDS